MNVGLADGTIVLSDSEYEEDSSSELECEYLFYSKTSSQLIGLPLALFGPVTSTPFVRKTVSKGRKTIGEHTVKVSVHDGLAMRAVNISASESLLELLGEDIHSDEAAESQGRDGV